MIKKLKHLAFLGLIIVCACQKLPNMGNDDGVPATPEQVRDAVQTAWGSEDFSGLGVKLHEKVWFSKSVQLFNTPAREFEQQLFNVLDIQNTSETIDGVTKNYRDIHIAVSKKDVSDSSVEKPTVTQEYTYRFDAAPPLTPAGEFQTLASPEQISLHSFILYATACFHDEQFNWKPYCYNLKKTESIETIPDLNKDGCPGLTDCKINVTKIVYDLVSETKDSATGQINRQKNIITLKISRDLPYLSRFLSICFQGMGSYNKQPYVATVCTDVVDYDRGTP